MKYSTVVMSKDNCKSLGFVNNPPRGYFKSVKLCTPIAAKIMPFASVGITPSLVVTDNEIIKFQKKYYDDFNVYDTTTGTFTIPLAGLYTIDVHVNYDDFVGMGLPTNIGVALWIDSESPHSLAGDSHQQITELLVEQSAGLSLTLPLKTNETFVIRAIVRGMTSARALVGTQPNYPVSYVTLRRVG